MFVHLDDVDHAGHSHNWGSKEYIEAVQGVDAGIARMISALEEAGIDQDTIVIISSDHGGENTSHGAFQVYY